MSASQHTENYNLPIYEPDDIPQYIGETDSWNSTMEAIDAAIKTASESGGGGGSSIQIVQTTGSSTTAVMSQNAVTETIESIAAPEIVQTTGESTTDVMSQKAVTDSLPVISSSSGISSTRVLSQLGGLKSASGTYSSSCYCTSSSIMSPSSLTISLAGGNNTLSAVPDGIFIPIIFQFSVNFNPTATEEEFVMHLGLPANINYTKAHISALIPLTPRTHLTIGATPLIITFTNYSISPLDSTISRPTLDLTVHAQQTTSTIHSAALDGSGIMLISFTSES